MPLLRKLVTFAVTAGLAKKAWDAWRENKAVAAGGRGGTAGPDRGKASASWRRDRREGERRDRD
jgi:hypothetical protein